MNGSVIDGANGVNIITLTLALWIHRLSIAVENVGGDVVFCFSGWFRGRKTEVGN